MTEKKRNPQLVNRPGLFIHPLPSHRVERFFRLNMGGPPSKAKYSIHR